MDANRKPQDTPVTPASGNNAPPAGDAASVAASKTQLLKTQSEVSVTPSQAADSGKQGKKNPLDALSRTAIRGQAMERRSGLQDVSEDYLKANVFAKPFYTRNSGLNDVQVRQNPAALAPAGQPSHGFMNESESTYKLKVCADPGVQATAASPPSQQQMPADTAAAPQQLGMQQQQPQPTRLSAGQEQTQAQNRNPPATSMPAANEPDMCTTCPNCQTTIYLVRGNDVPAAAPMPGSQEMPPEQ